jgi:hypothetical protein
MPTPINGSLSESVPLGLSRAVIVHYSVTRSLIFLPSGPSASPSLNRSASLCSPVPVRSCMSPHEQFKRIRSRTIVIDTTPCPPCSLLIQL